MQLHEFEVIKNGHVTDGEIADLRESVHWDHQDGLYTKILAKSYTYYIIRDGACLVGFLSVISDGVADALLVDLMVHPKYQNQGIGTCLVQQAINDLKEDGIPCIHVTFEERLEKFYQRIGFHIFKGGIIDFKHQCKIRYDHVSKGLREMQC